MADLVCSNCESTDLVIAYRVPVYAYVSDSRVTRTVVISNESVALGGVARCLTCDQFWILDEKPDLGAWPAAELER